MYKSVLARYLWKVQDEIDTSDEDFRPNWRWYGIVKLSDWTTHRMARRLVIRWSEKMQKEKQYPYWVAVIEVTPQPVQTLIYILIGNVDSKERCIDWWKGQGVTSVSLSNYKPGAFCPFVIDKSDDDSSFEAATDFHYTE